MCLVFSICCSLILILLLFCLCFGLLWTQIILCLNYLGELSNFLVYLHLIFIWNTQPQIWYLHFLLLFIFYFFIFLIFSSCQSYHKSSSFHLIIYLPYAHLNFLLISYYFYLNLKIIFIHLIYCFFCFGLDYSTDYLS